MVLNNAEQMLYNSLVVTMGYTSKEVSRAINEVMESDEIEVYKAIRIRQLENVLEVVRLQEAREVEERELALSSTEDGVYVWDMGYAK